MLKPKQARAEPTVNALLAAAVARIEAGTDEELRIDDILAETGVSRGSLYHHFGDRQGLLDAARAAVFEQMVGSDLDQLRALVEMDAEQALAMTEAANREFHSPERAPNRLMRALVIGRAGQGSSAEVIAAQQDEYTETLTGILRSMQDAGTLRADLDPMAVAVMLQALALGRVVDDVAGKKVDPDAWVDTINVVTRSLLAPEVATELLE